MEKDVKERFERIEDVLQLIAVAHLELEASQKNKNVALERFVQETRNRGARNRRPDRQPYDCR
jgi:hypothetical protein